jgi:CHAT domain-containing protein
MGLYEKAEPLYIKANKIKKETLGTRNNEYAEGLDNLSGLYIGSGQFAKAIPLLTESREIMLQNILQTFTVLSEKEKGNLMKWGYENIAAKPNSVLYYYPGYNPGLLKNNFNQLLLFKGLTLSDTKLFLDIIRSERDTATKKLFIEWQAGKAMLAKQYSLPTEKRIPGLNALETKTEETEKELVKRSADFRNRQNFLQVTLHDVQNKLRTDEVAIEFVNFGLYNKKWTDSTIYAAYILNKKDSVPVFVPLCEEKQLNKLFSNSTSSSGSIKSLYRSDPVDEVSTEISLGDSLYALIWKPLLPYLDGIKKINYSPSGLLNRIAFQALPTPDSQLLIDKYKLNQYISTRQLAIDEIETKNKSKSITLFGDCAFTMDSVSIVKNIPAKKGVSNIYSADISRDEYKASWRQLEGTATEVNQVKNLFAKNKIDTASYLQQKATEEQFKSLSGNSPTILHLATHGFFLPDPEQKRKEGLAVFNANTFKLADDPMMRSGIVLSGANRVWNGQQPVEGREDGIVTAYEISQLDLRNTELVVLSACETALGDIKGTEGVFGLQRAFKLAGVKSMLLSLWKVPDKETAELMTAFYQYYLSGNTAREALHKAQLDMKKKYRPYYWAAFVLIE